MYERKENLIVKIIIVAIIGVIFTLILKEKNHTYGYLAAVAICILLLFWGLEYIQVLFESFGIISTVLGEKYYISMILKMIGITYICEFGAQICKDAGQAAIAGQIEMLGKITILVTGFPVVLTIMEQLLYFTG